MNVFDFNFFAPIGHNPPIPDRKGATNAIRADRILRVDEFFPKVRIQQMRSPVSRGASDSDRHQMRCHSDKGPPDLSEVLSGIERLRTKESQTFVNGDDFKLCFSLSALYSPTSTLVLNMIITMRGCQEENREAGMSSLPLAGILC